MITQKEINQMLDKHELWLSGEKTKGVQLFVEDGVFSELNVADRHVIDVMLAGSKIKKCTLANTDFYYSNLASVIFLEVKMSGVILTKSNLDYSIVKNCDVTSSKIIRATFCEAEVEGVDFFQFRYDKGKLYGCNSEKCKVYQLRFNVGFFS
ncbi:pentapeptide repeat-containing protein [Brevibacillus brevis]|uniref:pentapeptide repeat-containing protein n=1 Tax=Brevibacillus brevis TaxID=1393 RepID=UPI000E27022C|nr:pentapeptide repeat-containing protein [Brevibacillus brevis]RED28219.1 hypothetical protein DES34_10881 [Brevibacillus brevis]GEC90506.1 hypothetical protein BBR01nite_28370 [Brevibacillus brevis]VEF90915.1 Uncharacterised protein [Brevibacillus brevis]